MAKKRPGDVWFWVTIAYLAPAVIVTIELVSSSGNEKRTLPKSWSDEPLPARLVAGAPVDDSAWQAACKPDVERSR